MFHILVMPIILLNLLFLIRDHRLTMALFLLYLALAQHLVKLPWTLMLHIPWAMMINILTPEKPINRLLPLQLKTTRSPMIII
jgi:hypothetical protein